MLIAPAAPLVFKDFPRVLGYLHSLGVEAFYPVLPYADITVWAYYRILKENPQTKLIASACIGTNRYLKHHEAYTGYLCSVFSPLLCAARYLKTYRRLEKPLAFLSPCRLKKNEFITQNQEELVRYNITIDGLNTWLAEEAVDLQRYEPFPQETDRNGEGLTVAAFGGIGKALAALLPDFRYRVEQGLGNVRSYLSQSREFEDAQSQTMIFEPYACKGGCVYGSGIGNHRAIRDADFLKGSEKGDHRDILTLFSYYDGILNPEDFRHGTCGVSAQNPMNIHKANFCKLPSMDRQARRGVTRKPAL
jgi:iron only hydrogenase large subunit-like protein